MDLNRTSPQLALLVATLFGIGCREAIAPLSPPPPSPNVASVTIVPDGITIGVGDTVRFHASGGGSASEVVTFIWTVTAPALAQVDSAGLVQAIGAGILGVRACRKEQPNPCGGATVTIR